MVNKSQVPIIELKNTKLKENRVQKALTDSSSLNTSWADNTEATYGKGGSLGQSKLTENSFLSSSERSEDLIVDQIEGSGTNLDNIMSDVGSEEQQINRRKRKIGITSKAIVKSFYKNAKRQSHIYKDQKIIEADFIIVTHKKRNTRSAARIGSSNERHKLYKKDERGGDHSTPKKTQYASYWKFNTKCLMNKNIKKGIEEELQGHITIDTWDVLKNRIQAKIRQYKPCLSSKKKVTRLYKKIAKLQEEVIRYPERKKLKIVIEQLQKDLQKEFTSLKIANLV
ncbi:3109_t:CDS:2 [Gigaspora margarita]|uniref:3109_t:CDS:1 n=1 Tax=Gigaspora margarita TaxID=4874 RepID=A0ABN7V5K4_GIGMA|nr:3109_t:CDS:2 [Gigaspora margarita]